MEDSIKTSVTLHVCVTCRRGDEAFEPKEGRSGHKMRLALSQAVDSQGGSGIEVTPAECLSGCKRACTVALVSPGKWTYVIADLDPVQHAADVVTFAAQYAAHPDGVPVWRDRPEIVKRSVLARVPPLRPLAKQ